MNLIEQLGGYEAAKEYLANLEKIPMHEQTEDTLYWLPDMLLEYRRQHNIFEVEDKVVVKAEPFWPEDYLIQTVGQEHIGKWYMSAWRHATDEEIKAGKRLEVNQ